MDREGPLPGQWYFGRPQAILISNDDLWAEGSVRIEGSANEMRFTVRPGDIQRLGPKPGDARRCGDGPPALNATNMTITVHRMASIRRGCVRAAIRARGTRRHTDPKRVASSSKVKGSYVKSGFIKGGFILSSI